VGRERIYPFTSKWLKSSWEFIRNSLLHVFIDRCVKEVCQKDDSLMKIFGMKIFGAANKCTLQEGNYPAALRVAAPLLPSIAVLVTTVAYLVLGKEVAKVLGENAGPWQQVMYGDFAVLGGFLTGLLVWFTVALFQKRYTSADYVSRRNYNKLKERFDSLKIRVEEGEKNVKAAESEESENGDLQRIRRQAFALAESECDAVEEGLKGKGMPVVTGLAYIELWHRVHRAEEALIKIEPLSEVLEGAMRDESRLANANMENNKSLLEQLDKAVAKLEGPETGNGLLDKAKAIAKLEGSETGNGLSVRADPPQRSKENAQVTPEERMKARTMLCEVRYEIDNFRDNSWEGLVNLRNSLADTVILLGLTTYALLALAIFLEAPPKTIIWAVTYFLIGAIAGLFARAQSEWGAETAVDDFGLSKARLLQIPWLSGLAATGGVVVTSILDPQTKTVDLASVFSNRPALLFVAAVFGITPNLLIQRLDDQADKTKDDLESTQTSQSTEDSQSGRSRQRRSFSTHTR
jgi:hypothetical protein